MNINLKCIMKTIISNPVNVLYPKSGLVLIKFRRIKLFIYFKVAGYIHLQSTKYQILQIVPFVIYCLVVLYIKK